MALKIANAKKIQSKSRINTVCHISGDNYEVHSGTSGKVYQVRLSGLNDSGTCTCDWAKYRPVHDKRSGCSHVLAAIQHAEQVAGNVSVSAWTSQADAERQHRRTLDIGDGLLVTVRATA